MPNRMPPVHPGEILAQELAELGLSANAFARALAVPANRVTAILKGSRRVTADTALRHSCYFGNSAELWLNLQQSYDRKIAEQQSGKAIRARVRPRQAA